MLSEKQVECLLLKPWERIITSGGFLGEQKSNGVYIIFGDILVLFGMTCLSLYSAEISFDKGRDDYDFFIEISEASFPLDHKSANRNTPPIVPVVDFPSDCRLDYLRDFGIEKLDYEVHPKSYTQYYDDVNYDLILATPLIITCKNGARFKIEPSEESLGCLEISMIT